MSARLPACLFSRSQLSTIFAQFKLFGGFANSSIFFFQIIPIKFFDAAFRLAVW
jgi:hypothetical protein